MLYSLSHFLRVKLGGAVGVPFLFVAMLLSRPALAAHDTTPEREAWYLVKQRCYLCHFIDRQDLRWGAKWGPTLKDLFKRQKLMNGKPVNDQTVSEWIADGSTKMPAFKYTLNPREIQLIVTYLKGGFPNAPRQDGTYAEKPSEPRP
jgi:mono/diheme cytochrome c family protein